MELTLVYPIIFFILYGVGLYFWNKKVVWRLSDRISRSIIYLHYSLFLLVIISAVLEVIDHLSFVGQWTTRIMIIGFLSTGIFIGPLTNWANKLKIEKYYFKILSLFPVLTFLFSLIPFLGVVIVFSIFGQLTSPVKKIFYEDDQMRIQSSFSGVLAPPRLLIYKKMGLFEKQLVNSFKSAADTDSISFESKGDTLLVIMHDQKEIIDTLRIKKIELVDPKKAIK